MAGHPVQAFAEIVAGLGQAYQGPSSSGQAH